MDYVRFNERPALRRPPMICAFKGWNDGGEAASVAAEYLKDRWEARTFAELDPEEFFDFQVNRPVVRLEGGVSRLIEWPRGEFSAASPGGRDLVMFTASEPNVRWRTFTTTVIDTAKDLGSDVLITLGAFLTDVPHSRPVPVVGSAQNLEAAARLGLTRSQYEGPTGIVGVLHDASNRAGLPSVSLWAAVPHYLPAMPNPKAALALVEKASALLGIPVETRGLTQAMMEWERKVNSLVEENEELGEYVRRLEAGADESARSLLQDQPVPSGEVIAAELERYLREQGGASGGLT